MKSNMQANSSAYRINKKSEFNTVEILDLVMKTFIYKFQLLKNADLLS